VRAFLARAYDFKGRATLSEFWPWWLGLGLVSFVLNLPLLLMAAASPILMRSHTELNIAQWVVQTPVSVAACALIFRRLHDRGRSGFWMVGAAALLLAISPLVSGNRPVVWLLFALFGLVAMWLALELMFLPSTTRPNRYADPRPAPA
jgi:uncharacterized membrane protein YhaH (DUF805 family)